MPPAPTAATADVHKYVRDVKNLLKAKSDAKIPDGWFAVSKDSKEENIEKFYKQQLDTTRSLAKSAIGNSHIKTKMYYEVSTTPASNTALALASGICADNSSEFAGFAGLYDEYRILGGRIKFRIQNSQGSPNASCQWAAMGFDSSYATVPSSTVDVLESTQSAVYGIDPAIANNFLSPLGTSDNGHYTFEFHIPRETVANAAVVTGGVGVVANFPGQWIASASTAGTSSGYIRTYVPTPGSSNTLVYRAIVELDVEWRERT